MPCPVTFHPHNTPKCYHCAHFIDKRTEVLGSLFTYLLILSISLSRQISLFLNTHCSNMSLFPPIIISNNFFFIEVKLVYNIYV